MNRTIFFLIVIGTILLSGCWNKRELTDIAVVSALAIDKNEEGKYVGTFQVINAGNIASGEQGGGGENAPIRVFSATGESLIQMSRNAAAKMPRQLFYEHVKLLVISEELAKNEGINTIFDSLDRSPNFRITTRVVLARDTEAANVVKVLTAIEKLPSEGIIKTLKSAETMQGETVTVDIHAIMNALRSPGKEPVISAFTLKGDEKSGERIQSIQSTTLDANLQAKGIGVFKEGKLIDWLEDDAASGTVWALNKIQRTVMTLDWENEIDAVALEVIRQNTGVTIEMISGKPKISIEIRAEGDIREVKNQLDLSHPNILMNIEKKLGKKLKTEIEDAILRAQENKSDIFGFGEMVYQDYPEEWKKIKADWQDVHFPELKVDVKTDIFVRQTGLRNKPYFSDFE
ncbi:Ger(x)C family spore germination protein [Jeotgalibacillus sp. S-D1]|uniref:Ger(x)C family spore germination protein n=1 Tax=Jeotgalibacillus sp. S-D1 TaxID=2552189 RepID=UPI00105A2F10|nr:Ger(x)C family spore germination protein [Jeotgalibacillus sp. S-D1]TDL32738.1 Ger(x)C family spore germination protein [Jeotgalibacillus sp. S-D1]